MRCNHFTGGLTLCLLSILLAADASAQARRTTPTGAVPVQPATKKETLIIKKMETTLTRTPEFRSDANEPLAPAREWTRIRVTYETTLEWIDELEFRYSVLVKNPKAEQFIMFPGSVTYVEISKGKQHFSAVFLRPNTILRYGNVVWAGVKVYLNGEQVATAQSPDDQRPWSINYKTLDNVLLNREQTPFALIAIDNYETIKPK